MRSVEQRSRFLSHRSTKVYSRNRVDPLLLTKLPASLAFSPPSATPTPSSSTFVRDRITCLHSLGAGSPLVFFLLLSFLLFSLWLLHLFSRFWTPPAKQYLGTSFDRCKATPFKSLQDCLYHFGSAQDKPDSCFARTKHRKCWQSGS